MQSFSPILSPATIALLVDGENLSRSHADVLLQRAAALGPLRYRRVYGAMERIHGWDDLGFRPCPTRPGKNAADLMLCVDAMDLALREGVETLLIASSDRDFTCLAERLREIGKRVIGLGEGKAPTAFRAACSEFVVLEAAKPKPSPGRGPQLSTLEKTVRDFIGPQGCEMARLGKLGAQGILISALPEKTWRKWLEARPLIFDPDPKGPNARVRLVQPLTP